MAKYSRIATLVSTIVVVLVGLAIVSSVPAQDQRFRDGRMRLALPPQNTPPAALNGGPNVLGVIPPLPIQARALGTPVRAMTPGIGTSVIIDVFIVTVIGGLGNLPGAFVGALVIGLMKAYGVLLFPDADLFMTYLIMALVLLFRPKGLLGGR